MSAQSHILSNIRAEMARHSKTQADIAELLGTTRQAVSRRLAGQVSFRIDELQKIADALDMSLANLVGEQKASA